MRTYYISDNGFCLLQPHIELSQWLGFMLCGLKSQTTMNRIEDNGIVKHVSTLFENVQIDDGTMYLEEIHANPLQF